MAEHNEEIVESAKLCGTGCVDCFVNGDWWLHLRRCATRGHIGCCDSSPSQHARKNFRRTKHAVIASFDPDQVWFYDFRTEGPSAVRRSWRRRVGIRRTSSYLAARGAFQAIGRSSFTDCRAAVKSSRLHIFCPPDAIVLGAKR
jgi:hypothetical protein